MTNAEKLTLAKHACHIRMGVIEGTHSAKVRPSGRQSGHREGAVLSLLRGYEHRPQGAEKTGPRPLRAVQGPCGSGTLRHAGRARVSSRWKNLKTLRKIAATCRATPT